MPVPSSARWVSRPSKRGTSAMCSSTVSGMPRSASSVRRTSLSAGSFIAYERTPFGSMSVIRLSMRIDHLRRVAGARERVEHVAGALRARVDEVERLAVEARLVRDVVHRRGDPVDRHDVRPADLEADEREPLAAARGATFWIALKK